MYKCGWNGCEKAYGTLNHLNAHVTMQSHGQKRTPEGMFNPTYCDVFIPNIKNLFCHVLLFFVLSIEICIEVLLAGILSLCIPCARGIPFTGVEAIPDMDWG
jgi:hypothetical protein